MPEEEITEYATAIGTGYHLRWRGADKFYPLAEWITAEREEGGKVLRRRIRVVEDWEEVDAP